MTKLNNVESVPHSSYRDNLDGIIKTVSNVSEDAIETSKKAVDKSVKFAKAYPLHTALGASVVGFVAGYVTNKIFKK